MVFFVSVGPVFGLLAVLALGAGAAVCLVRALKGHWRNWRNRS